MIKSKEDARFSAGTGDDPNKVAFELCETWQKSKLNAWASRTFTLDEISAFMAGVLAALALPRSTSSTEPACLATIATRPSTIIGDLEPGSVGDVPALPQAPVLTEAMIKSLAASLKACLRKEGSSVGKIEGDQS